MTLIFILFVELWKENSNFLAARKNLRCKRNPKKINKQNYQKGSKKARVTYQKFSSDEILRSYHVFIICRIKHGIRRQLIVRKLWEVRLKQISFRFNLLRQQILKHTKFRIEYEEIWNCVEPQRLRQLIAHLFV